MVKFTAKTILVAGTNLSEMPGMGNAVVKRSA